tara:strand:- start:1533 stop:2813 length:1281 start_codon:yes stop_codon:yes gene_type:complete
MSSLLEQAFVDAKALKEAALKNAEATIVEKYSTEVKETLEKILEQDGLDLGGPPAGGGMDPMGAAPAPAGDAAEDVPLGAAEGEELCGCDDEGEESTIKINFDELAETLQRLEEDLETAPIEEDEEIELTEEDLAALTEDDDSDEADKGSEVDYSAGVSDEKGDPAGAEAATLQANTEAEKELDEELDMDSLVDAIMEKIDLSEDDSEELEEDATADTDGSLEEMIDAITEKLYVDMGADLSGWAGRRAEDKKYEMEKELAARRSTGLKQDTHLGRGMADRTDTDPQTELDDLKQAQEELVFENNHLKEKLQNYQNVVEQLKESVTDVNLSNARLLYTNRVLRNTSLNERQKTKVVEAISKAGSVPEAKTIFETLQSTVESTPKRGPQSLSETINRRSSILRASSRSEAKKADPLSDRMKKLAGIN